VLVLFGLRSLAAEGGLVTTTGSRSWLVGALCVQASTGQRDEETAMEHNKEMRRDARRESEVMM
jgi:hypothetical protein